MTRCLLLAALALCMLLPACASAETITVTDFNGLYDALHEDKVYEKIIFGKDIDWNVTESGTVLPFEHDTVVDMAGHTLYVDVNVPDVIQVNGNADVTIHNGTIDFAYSTSVIGAYIRFVDDDAGRTNGKLTLDKVRMVDRDVQPSSNPNNTSHTTDIIQMNGEDRLTLKNGTYLGFVEAYGNSYTSTLFSAKDTSDTLVMRDASMSATSVKNGMINGTIIGENAEISINGMNHSDGYAILGEKMKMELENTEFDLWSSLGLGVRFDDAQLELRNGSRLRIRETNSPGKLTIGTSNVSIWMDDKSYVRCNEISVPDGTTIEDYFNTEDGVKMVCVEGRKMNTYKFGHLYTVRYTDGQNGTIFADEVYENYLYGENMPEFSYFEMNIPEGWVELGFDPSLTGSVKGDVTYVMQWAKHGVVYYEDGMEGTVFETQRYVLEEGEPEPPFAAADGGHIPVRAGYIFDGWVKGSDYTGIPVIYTAKWLAETFAVEGKQANIHVEFMDHDGDGKVVVSAEEAYVQEHDKKETVVAAKISADQFSKALSGENGRNKIEELTIALSSSMITFDRRAMEAIVSQMAPRETVTLVNKRVSVDSLTAEQKKQIQSLENALIFSITLETSGGKLITSFGGSEVLMEFPYSPRQGEGEDYALYYLAPDGMVTQMPTEWHDGKMYVRLEHFSEYVVLHKPDAAAAADQPKTGDSSSLALWCAMLAVCSAALMMHSKRRHA